jgi:hypothetical protein
LVSDTLLHAASTWAAWQSALLRSSQDDAANF